MSRYSRGDTAARLEAAGWLAFASTVARSDVRDRRKADGAHRLPLRAGHPVTWGAITDGTALDGAAYVWRDPTAERADVLLGVRRTPLARGDG